MTRDYGLRARRRAGTGVKAALAVGAVAGLALVGGIYLGGARRERAQNIVDARAYRAAGPPCPAVTPAQLQATGPRVRHSFEYGGMQLSHAFGDADCAWIADHGGAGLGHYPICRFTSPGSLEVKAGAQDLLFVPGPGRPAAITRQGGQVRCVLTPREAGS